MPITTQDFLFSFIFCMIFTIAMALLHSLLLFGIITAVLTLALGVYMSFVGHIYKKARVQERPQLQLKLKGEDELSSGWLAGWFFVVVALGILPFMFLTTAGVPPLLQATFSGMGAFIFGLAIPLIACQLRHAYIVLRQANEGEA